MSLIATDGIYMSAVEWICGIKRNRLQVWLGNGWVKASKTQATGSGSRNIFDEYDLVMIYIFKKAVESGLSRAAVANLIPSIYSKIHLMYTIQNGIIEPRSKKDKALYVFFFRKDGMLLETFFSNRKSFGNLPTPRVLNEADDVIGFNIAKMISILNDRRVNYFKE